MSRLVPSLAAALASGCMLCCAASTSLVTDGPTSGLFGLFGSVRASRAATASCSRPTWALKNADRRLSMLRRYRGRRLKTVSGGRGLPPSSVYEALALRRNAPGCRDQARP